MKKISLWIMAGSILLGIAPFISVLITAVIANGADCVVDESAAHACIVPVLGDIGGILSIMGMMGWFTFFTVPIGVLGLFIGLVMFAGTVLFQTLRRRTPPLQD